MADSSSRCPASRTSAVRRWWVLVVLGRLGFVCVAAMVTLPGCPTPNGDPAESSGDDDDAEACVELDLENCAMLYPATWNEVFSQTLLPTCAGGSACHVDADATGAKSGVYFDESEATHARLIAGETPIVRSGDPHCSPIVMRIESADPDRRMPPGNTALSDGARCSIAHWIADGALP